MPSRTVPLPEFGTLPDDALARLGQIIPAVVPVGRTTWWRMVRDGRAPAPAMPSPGIAAWHVGTLRAWMAARAA